ncbi:MAG TPA: ABC transporter permease [Acidimicrobiales bacterium]|nr:ABC transporter permease [Acidimicrobiales bacterium]
MTAPVQTPGTTPLGPRAPFWRNERAARFVAGNQMVVYALIGLFLLSVTRFVADTGDLTSSGTSGAMLRLAVPIGLAALGGIYAERAGVVNIGLEGMMILGTWFGAWGAWQFGPWWGIAIGLAGGAIGGLIHAVSTVTFGVDHIISGVAINILGAGLARYLSVITYTPETGGGATQSPTITEQVPSVSLPVLSGGEIFGWQSPDLFGWFEDKGWFLVSDVGGILKGFTADLSWFTIIALLLFPFTAWLLWRTRFGLRLRSCGENPYAAESLGVNVYRMKYAGVVISGAMAGLGGAFLSLVAASLYREGQTGGRGFIGLAAMIFGNWMPFGAMAGAGLFGFADALQLRSDEAIQALLLFVALLAAVFALRAGFGRRMIPAAALAVTSVGFLAWFVLSEEVPRQFVSFTPHVTTLLVLGFASQKLRMPAADGQPYRKGESR